MDKNEKIIFAIGAVIGVGIATLVANIQGLRNMNKMKKHLDALGEDITEYETESNAGTVCHEGL